jgi:hypothetical protein
MGFVEILFWLLFAHALMDWTGLQGDFLAQAKNPNTAIGAPIWGWGLVWHSLLHAGAVAYVTGSLGWAAFEFVGHAITDHLKNTGRISFHTDQSIHVAMKVIIALVIAGPELF